MTSQPPPRNPLTEFFKTLGINCMLLSRKKKILATAQGFSLFAVFSRLDFGRKNYISVEDVDEFLKVRGISTSDDELFYVFKTLDARRASSIDMRDLAQFFNIDPRSELAGTPTQSSQAIPAEIDIKATDIFKQLIENYQKLQEAKALFCKSANPSSIIEEILSRPGRSASVNDVRAYLIRNGLSSGELLDEVERELRKSNILQLNTQTLQSLLGLQHIQTPLDETKGTYFEAEVERGQEQSPFEVNMSGSSEREYLKDLREMRSEIMRKVNKRREVGHNSIDMPDSGITPYQNKYPQARTNHFDHNPQQNPTKAQQSVTLKRTSSAAHMSSQEQALPYERIHERAGYEARKKIEEIEIKARNKVRGWTDFQNSYRNQRTTNHHSSFSKKVKQPQGGDFIGEPLRTISPNNSQALDYDRILLEERARRIELEKELNRSRSEIMELKKHLSILQDSCRVFEEQPPTNWVMNQTAKTGLSSPKYSKANQGEKKSCFYENPSSSFNSTALSGFRDSSLRKGPAYFGSVPGCLHNTSSTDQLEQALRRSKIEREFAKFKLESGRNKGSNRLR